MNRPRYGTLYAIAILCVIFEATLSHRFSFGPVRPELVYVLPVFWGLEARSDGVTFHAWTAGLLKDLFSVTPFGTYGVLFLIAAFLLCTLRDYLFRDHVMTLLVVCIVFELTVNLLYGFGFFLLGANFSITEMLQFSAGTAIYSGVLGIALLKPMVHYETEFGFYHY